MKLQTKLPVHLQTMLYALTASLFCILLSQLHSVEALGCFVCSSINGSEPECEDTFNNTGRFYVPNCSAGRKERSGLFPGTECIKMKAELAERSFTILVRTCVVDNGDINSETEIGRVDHCGLVDQILYNDTMMLGCILQCRTAGCNGGTSVPASLSMLVSALTFWAIVSFASWHRR